MELSASADATNTTDESGEVNVAAASKASSRITETSTPINAAGVRPKALSALKRPPTFGSAFTVRKPAALDCTSRGDCGSVTTTR